MTTLVPEDGSGSDPTANTFATLVEIRAYNVDRGRTVSADDVVLTGEAIQAMDYIQSLEPQMDGTRTNGYSQPLCFPRDGLYLFGTAFPNDSIPVELKNAQAELVYQVEQGIVLLPTKTGQDVKRRKIGPIEREFFGPNPGTSMEAASYWLQLFLVGGGARLPVVRV